MTFLFRLIKSNLLKIVIITNDKYQENIYKSYMIKTYRESLPWY